MQQSLFRKKTERINWKTLAAVDIDRVVSQNDVRVLRDNIKHVAFCNIDTELDLRECDSGLLKLFKLSQLMIDYLLSSQDVLTGTVTAAEERAQMAIEEAETAKRKLQDSEAYLGDVKRECHRRKKLILAQQQIMDSGPNAYHRCPYCEKAFLNGSFLQLHLEKRHADRYIASVAEWRLHHRDDGPAGTSPRRRHSPSPQQGQHAHVLTSERVELLLQQLLERSTGGGGGGGSGRHGGGGHRKTVSGGGVGSPQGDGNLDNGSQRSLRDRDLRDRENEERMRKLSEAFQQDRDRWQDEAQRLRDEIRHLRRKTDRRHQPQVEDQIATAGQTTQEQMERARQKAIDSRNKKANATHDQQGSPSRHVITKKPEEALRASMDSQTRPQNASGNSPTRVPSPRKTSSSPARRDTMDQHSLFKSSNVSLDRLDVSQDLLDKFCDEVRHMLDDHLELHGIPRGTTGIPGSVLQDKLKLINHGQEQMKSKYADYAEIRRRLEAEVNQEASARVAQGALDKPTHQRQQQQYPHSGDSRPSNVDHKNLRDQGPGPLDRDRLPASTRSARSSQSDWDDDSHTRVNVPLTNSPQRLMQQATIQAGHVNDYRPAIDVKTSNQSPRKSPDRRSNAHLSSDFSNTIDSSAWQTESKAVTSVPPRGSQAQRPTGTNRSSDYDDRSDFST